MHDALYVTFHNHSYSETKFCRSEQIHYLADTMPATPLTFIQSHVKLCLRCSESFACHAAEDMPCDCFTVQLSAETKDYIQQLGYTDCLCNTCLRSFEEQVAQHLHSEEHA